MSLKGSAHPGQKLVGRINAISLLTISAYGIAVKNGFEGTEEEWLKSLEMSPKEVETAVNRYLEENPVAIDTTLSVKGQAADAQATGTAIANKVPLSGGEMTGTLKVPTLSLYPKSGFSEVFRFLDEGDKKLFTIYRSDSGDVRLAKFDIDTQKYESYSLPSVTSGLTANTSYKLLTSKELVSIAQGGTNAKTAAQALANLGGLPLSGGTMTGALKMNSNSITGLPAPTASSHAVNKSYADGIKETAANALSKANQAYSDANAAGATAYAAQQIANAAIPSSQNGAANGVASLDKNKKVNPRQARSTILSVSEPSVAITNVHEGLFIRVYGAESDVTFTLPSDGDDDCEIGAEIEILRNTRYNVTIKAPSDRYLLYPDCSTTSKGGSLKIANMYGCVALKRVAAQTWIAAGDIE